MRSSDVAIGVSVHQLAKGHRSELDTAVGDRQGRKGLRRVAQRSDQHRGEIRHADERHDGVRRKLMVCRQGSTQRVKSGLESVHTLRLRHQRRRSQFCVSEGVLKGIQTVSVVFSSSAAAVKHRGEHGDSQAC
jgi:hypothetical protein